MKRVLQAKELLVKDKQTVV